MGHFSTNHEHLVSPTSLHQSNKHLISWIVTA